MNQEPFWMPFSANRTFKTAPKMVVRSDGMYYYDGQGKPILDMAAGLWCSNLGHGRKEVADAISKAAHQLDYAPTFNFGHPSAFELAERLTDQCDPSINHVFFTTSGSDAVDTALKIALAYQRLNGRAGKNMIISRAKAYHGVNFGGTAVGGVEANTRMFERWGNVDFLPHTLDTDKNAFTRGLPAGGIEEADALLDLIALHGADQIAAVILEPVAGAGGLIPPPQDYLKRIETICREHDILLILDEVICAFGRIGDFTGGQRFGVTPDIFTSAKGLTNGAVPMGAVFVNDEVFDAFMQVDGAGIELFHGYTYSGHPLACAAALACLDLYQQDGVLNRAAGEIAQAMETTLHQFRSANGIKDIRNFGLLGAIEFTPTDVPGEVGTAVVAAAWRNGLVLRGLGDTVAVSPPLIMQAEHNAEFGEKLSAAIREAVGK